MNAHTQKSGFGPTVPMAPKAVRKFAAALGWVPWGAPVGAVVLLMAGAARPRGLMGRVMVRPLTAPLYEASCPGSYNPPKMDSHWGMHSNLRPERCSFTHPLFSHWRKHSSQLELHIKAPSGPVKTLACVNSPAPIGSGMGDSGFPGKGFLCPCPPRPRVPPAPPPPPHPCCGCGAAKGGKMPSVG